MATNRNFITYKPTYTPSRKKPSLAYDRLKSYEELLADTEKRLETDRQLKEFADNLERYQQALKQEEEYKAQLEQQQLLEAERERAKSEAGFFKRVGQTIADTFLNIGGGGQRATEQGNQGILNISSGIQKSLQDIEIMPRGGSLTPSGNIDNSFIKDRLIGNTSEKMFEKAQGLDVSYWKDLSPRGQEIAYGTMQAVGEMLPSIGFTVASGGAAGPGMIATGLKAFGGASTQALDEGATYGQAFAYGGLNVGVEVATEKIVGSALDKFGGAGKGLINPKKIASSKAVQVGIGILGEGAEEGLAEVVDPIMKRITYDKDAMDHFLTKEHGEEILTSAIIGSLTGGVFESANVVINRKTNADSAEILSKYDDIVMMEQALQQEGRLTQEQANEFSRIKQELEAQMQLKLNKLNPNQRMQLISKFNDSLMFQNYDPFLAGSEVTRTTQALEANQQQINAFNAGAFEVEKANALHETFKKINPDIAKITFDNTLSNDIDGYYNRQTYEIVINPNLDNQYSRVLNHELTHSLEGTPTYNELQNYTLDYLRQTGEYQELRNTLEPLYRERGLLDGMTQEEIDAYMNHEIMSKYSERLFTDPESINRLINQKRSLARKILEWIKEKLGLLTGRLSKQELELKRHLEKIESLYVKALGEVETREVDTHDIREDYDKKIKNKHKKFSLNEEQHKKKQFEIISKLNPMRDDYHVGIRSVNDIKTFSEAINDPESFVWGDFTKEQALEAERKGVIRVYSSKDIVNGNFVSTSYKQALEYAGNNKNRVKSKIVKVTDVAWINGDEGIFAKVDLDADIRYSLRHSQNKQTIIKSTESYLNQEAQDIMKTDALIYEVSKNKETVEKARTEIKGKDVQQEIEKTIASLEKTFKATKDNEVLVAKAMLLLQEANKQGLNAHINDLATSVSAVLTQMGKTTQAGSIIQRLSPEGRLLTFRKIVELENERIRSRKGEYTNRKRFKTISKERFQQWFNQDLRVIKNRAVDTFLNNHSDINLSKEQISRLKNLTTTSDNFTNNVIDIFKQALPKDLDRANELGTQFATEVLNQQKQLQETYDNQPVVIPEVLVEQMIKAKGEKNIKEVAKKIERVINSQKASNMFEKAMQWRYLAMLANPKTHFRNIIGNATMSLVVDTRNAISRAMQSIFVKNPELRTRTFKKPTAQTVLYVENLANELYQEIQIEESKYIEAKQGKRVFTNKLLETIREFNYLQLEGQDLRISKARFTKELSEWMTAKNYTVEQMKNDSKIREAGIQFAYQEALKATFRDASKLATLINKIKSHNALGELFAGAIMPFTKTPINIAKRGFEYSPAGLIKNLTYDIYQLNQGKITISQYLDKLSEGFTGTMIALIGLFLAKIGILSGGDDENKKVSNYERALGQQPFSIKIGDKTYTLDWMAPSSIPLFTGVAIYEDLIDKNADDEVIWSIAGAISASLDPMTEMSFLQGFNRILSTYDNNKLQGIVLASLESYASQFIPTISNQIARLVDDVRRTTSTTGKTSSKKKFTQRSNYMISRIPFLSKQLEPYVNVWGEIEQNSDFVDRLMENTAYPFWISKNKPSFVDDEIMRLYKISGNTSILPGIPNSYYTKDGERIDMTPEEYTEFKIKVGTFSKKQLQEIFTSQFYKDLDDEEKEKVIEKVYSRAREFAKSDMSKEYLVYQALSVNNNQDKLMKYLVELESIQGIKDKEGNTVQGSKKKNIMLYIQSQKLKKEQKHLLLALAGYQNTSAKEDVVNFINSLKDLNEEQKQRLLEIYNY